MRDTTDHGLWQLVFTNLVFINELPKDDEQLLGARNLLDRPGQVGGIGLIGVVEEPTHSLEYEGNVILARDVSQRVPEGVARHGLVLDLDCVEDLLRRHARHSTSGATVCRAVYLCLGSSGHVVEESNKRVERRVDESLLRVDAHSRGVGDAHSDGVV